MKDHAWKQGAGRLAHACSSRVSNDAHLWAQRIRGAVQSNATLAWEWRVSKGSEFHYGPYVKMSGEVENEEQARAAADAALPAVLRAFEALASEGR